MDLANQNKTKILLSKVPEVTIFFWVIKVLCTTVGETLSDFLNINLGLGLFGTAVSMGIAFAVILSVQFSMKKYVAGVYWTTVVLISVFGTLVTDIMTDALGIPLEYSTILFSVLLIIVFAVWYISEKTLSIHSIYTKKREAFYWLAILVTFALGTAVGDLYSETLALGYLMTGLLVLGLIALDIIAWRAKFNNILVFWIAYILTRPLGASIGDFLSQPTQYGGLNLGATVTSIIFVVMIVLTVCYLAITKKDIGEAKITGEHVESKDKKTLFQTITVILAIGIIGFSIYNIQFSKLANSNKSLGDLTQFETIEKDMLNFVESDDMKNANLQANSLETAWDQAQSDLRSKNVAKWTEIDKSIDDVLSSVRDSNPNKSSIQESIKNSITVMQKN
ncbi:MAG: hypothetical protein Q8942_19010 [Bacillota bacterium]|nr:hypothetical protein [Bacillota bacterium]